MKLAERILWVNSHSFVDGDEGCFRFLHSMLYLRNIGGQCYRSCVVTQRFNSGDVKAKTNRFPLGPITKDRENSVNQSKRYEGRAKRGKTVRVCERVTVDLGKVARDF